MLILAVFCALITAALICVVSLWHRHVRAVSPLDQAKTLYAGFVADVDRREARGEVEPELANEERVEAARALLKAEALGVTPPPVLKPVHAIIVAVVAALFAFGLYTFVIGHPYLPDQPYGTRLKAWTQAAGLPDCSDLKTYDARLQGWLATAGANAELPSPDALVAVQTRYARACANIPAYWLFTGRLDMVAGHYYEGAKAFEKAQTLSPQTFSAWSEMGEALTSVAGGTVNAEAQGDFYKALAINAHDARAHYYLGRMTLEAGNYAAARQHFTEALAALAPDDGRRTVIGEQLRAVDVAEKGEAARRAQMLPRVKPMIEALEAKLKADPENPDGWARLLRSYDVIGDAEARTRAVAAMQAHYRDRTQIAAGILAKSQGAVGAEDTGGQ